MGYRKYGNWLLDKKEGDNPIDLVKEIVTAVGNIKMSNLPPEEQKARLDSQLGFLKKQIPFDIKVGTTGVSVEFFGDGVEQFSTPAEEEPVFTPNVIRPNTALREAVSELMTVAYKTPNMEGGKPHPAEKIKGDFWNGYKPSEAPKPQPYSAGESVGDHKVEGLPDNQAQSLPLEDSEKIREFVKGQRDIVETVA